MSFFPAKDPVFGDARSSDAIAQIIVPRSVDLGGSAGPPRFAIGALAHGRPVHFLRSFRPGGLSRWRRHRRAAASAYRPCDGDIFVRRRDRASRQPRQRHADPARRRQLDDRRPRHCSFRAHGPDHRDGGEPLHGLQLWVALPVKDEETAPAFAHTPSTDIPQMREDGLTLRVIAGAMHGLRSPVTTLWETIFAEVRLKAGTVLPFGTEYEERALYVISGEIEIGGYRHPSQQLLVLKPGDRTEVKALKMLISSWSAAPRWMDPAIFGGISCLRAKTASRPPRPIGKPAASLSSPATARSSFRCRTVLKFLICNLDAHRASVGRSRNAWQALNAIDAESGEVQWLLCVCGSRC